MHVTDIKGYTTVHVKCTKILRCGGPSPKLETNEGDFCEQFSGVDNKVKFPPLLLPQNAPHCLSLFHDDHFLSTPSLIVISIHLLLPKSKIPAPSRRRQKVSPHPHPPGVDAM